MIHLNHQGVHRPHDHMKKAPHTTSIAFLCVLGTAVNPVVSQASATKAAAVSSHGKLTSQDDDAIRRARASMLSKENHDNSLTTIPSLSSSKAEETETPQAGPGTVATPTPFAAEPPLLHKLQSSSEGSGVTASSHVKVVFGLLLLLVAGYAALRRLMTRD